MKGLIQKLKDIWKIQELKERILTTLLLVAVYRLGSFIVLPGIDTDALSRAVSEQQGANILDLINVLTGGAFAKASIFALGIMPYISASIIVQLMGVAVPYFQKMQKDESGRNRMNQITRGLTVLITLAQAPSYLSTYVPANAH